MSQSQTLDKFFELTRQTSMALIFSLFLEKTHFLTMILDCKSQQNKIEAVTKPGLAKAKRKRTNSEEDPNEPASKSVKLDNDLTFEFLQQLKAIFPNVGHQFLSQKAEEFALLQEERGEGDSSLQVIFFKVHNKIFGWKLLHIG